MIPVANWLIQSCSLHQFHSYPKIIVFQYIHTVDTQWNFVKLHMQYVWHVNHGLSHVFELTDCFSSVIVIEMMCKLSAVSCYPITDVLSALVLPSSNMYMYCIFQKSKELLNVWKKNYKIWYKCIFINYIIRDVVF